MQVVIGEQVIPYENGPCQQARYPGDIQVRYGLGHDRLSRPENIDLG